MKNITFIMALLLLWGCSDDNNIKVNDSAYFLKDDLQEVTLQVMGEDDFIYDLRIQEGGYYQKEFNGNVLIDYDYLVRYNALNNTDYKMLDEEYFSFDNNFTISADTSSTTIPLTVHTNKLFTDLGQGTYYIPFGLNSKTFEGDITKDKGNFLLALTLQKPGLKLVEKGTFEIDPSAQSEYTKDISAKLDVRSTTDLKVRYVIDSSLIESDRNILDDDYYSFEEEVIIAEGERTAENKIKVDVDNAPGGLWIIPIKMFTDDEKIAVEEDAYVTLLLNKGTLENLKWSSKYLLSADNEDALVFGPDSETELTVGTYEEDGTLLEASSSESWVQAEIVDGKVSINLDEFKGTEGMSRTAELSIFYPEGEYSKDITITQLSSGSVIGKENWSIQAGNNSTTATGNEPFSNIIDGDINTHWQWDWPNGDDSDFPRTPYEFIIDLSEPQIFNTIKLWQTQNATNGYVKDVQFEVSDDKSEWIDLGVYRMSDSTNDAKDKGADPYVYELPGVYKVRYVKLIILSNVGDEGVNSAKNAYLGEMDISFE